MGSNPSAALIFLFFTSVNNNDNLRVHAVDLSGFYPIAFDVQDHGIRRSVPWKHVSFLLGNGRQNSTVAVHRKRCQKSQKRSE